VSIAAAAGFPRGVSMGATNCQLSAEGSYASTLSCVAAKSVLNPPIA
jgi:hypothetical protein